MQNKRHNYIIVGVFFILARLILFISSPYEIIPGLGDYWNFYHQASLGWPFVDYWTEFPPVFPYIAKLLFNLVNGREVAFGYSLGLIMSLFQAGTVVIVFRLEDKISKEMKLPIRSLVYASLTFGLFYSWSYFDALAVFFMILGIYWVLEDKELSASISIAIGILTKWFPGLILPAMWKIKSKKEFILNTILILGIVALVWGGLYLINSDLTIASITAQANKGSWETVWALLDGNTSTGNFNPEVDRLVPESAAFKTGSDPLISPWISFFLFGGIGLYLLLRAEPKGKTWIIPFTGLTMVLFFLWSPGYSPQWILFLLPLILLSLKLREGILISIVLILVNLLEWPVLLSRGYFWSLTYLIPLRTALMILLAFRFYQVSKEPLIINQKHKNSEN